MNSSSPWGQPGLALEGQAVCQAVLDEHRQIVVRQVRDRELVSIRIERGAGLFILDFEDRLGFARRFWPGAGVSRNPAEH